MAGLIKLLFVIISTNLSTWVYAGDVKCDLDRAVVEFNAGNTMVASDLFTLCSNSDQPDVSGKNPEEVKAASSFYLGIISRQNKDLDTAAQHLALANRYDAANLSYQLEYAVTLEWMNDLDQARAIYQSILDRLPDQLEARLAMARLWHWQGDLRRSIADYHQLLSEYPDNLAIQSGLGYALMTDYKLDQARQVFDSVLESDADHHSAFDGIKMLQDIRTRKLELSIGNTARAGEDDVTQVQLNFSSNRGYSTKWGVELLDREDFSSPLSINSLPVNRAVRSSFSGFVNYRFNERGSTFFSYTLENIPNSLRQHKAQIELTVVAKPEHRFFVGALPAYISGERVNLMLYGGYIFKPQRDWSAMLQFFSSHDRDFQNSDALSFSVTKAYGKRNYFKLGASFSQTSSEQVQSIDGSFNHYLSREIAIKGSFVNNLSTNERQMSLGVIYEF